MQKHHKTWMTTLILLKTTFRTLFPIYRVEFTPYSSLWRSLLQVSLKHWKDAPTHPLFSGQLTVVTPHPPKPSWKLSTFLECALWPHLQISCFARRFSRCWELPLSDWSIPFVQSPDPTLSLVEQCFQKVLSVGHFIIANIYRIPFAFQIFAGHFFPSELLVTS